jgi:hypothetical protein
MKTTNEKAKKAAGTGFRADFKPTASKRQVRFAPAQSVQKHSEAINKEFMGAFKILAK